MATTPLFSTLETWTRDVSTEINSPDLRMIGITLSKFVINARYEGAFSKDSRKFVNAVKDAAGNNTEIRYDNRPSMFILGIGYNFK